MKSLNTLLTAAVLTTSLFTVAAQADEQLTIAADSVTIPAATLQQDIRTQATEALQMSAIAISAWLNAERDAQIALLALHSDQKAPGNAE